MVEANRAVGDAAGKRGWGWAAAGPGTGAGSASVPVEPVPPPARWRRRVLAAPGLVLAGVALLAVLIVLDSRRGEREAAQCRQLPLPWTQFAAAYAALLCGLAGSSLCVLLFRAAARAGTRGAASWQGTLALCICVANVLALLVEAIAVYAVHAAAGEPYWRCSGASALAGLHILMQSHVL